MKEIYPEYTDGVTVKVIFDKHYKKSLKDSDLITAGEARKLALTAVYYFMDRRAYREECANGAPTDAPITIKKIAD